MRYAILGSVVSLSLLVASAQAQEEYKNEVTVSAFGAFQQSTTGNGVTQSGQEQPGVLASYRYYITGHQGLEFDYGFSQFSQQFIGANSTPLNLTPLGLTGTSLNVLSNTHEATAGYVYRFNTIHRLRPFVSAGGGVLVFSPLSSAFGSAPASTFVAPDFTYSAGADLALSKRAGLRLGYRGDLFEAPGFGIAAIKTGNVTQLVEPFAGLSFRF